MKDAQKPDHETLFNVISYLREGQYVIPDFQRDFEWEPSDIRALMGSIFRDYYIGSLLLWQGTDENFDALACEPVYGFTGDAKRTHIVLDGQQRLTAMYYAFIAPDIAAPKRQNRFLYFINVDRFMEEDYENAFDYDWTRRGLNLLNDQDRQFETHMFPLSVIGEGPYSVPNWVQGYETFWRKTAETSVDAEASEAEMHAENAHVFGKYLMDIMQQYRIAFIEISQNIELEKVCDIFTQINSRGVRLDIFDLINALLKPKGLRLRQELWRDAEQRLAFVESNRMNVYVLQVMSILCQSYCSPKYLYYLLPDNPRHIRGTDGVTRPEVLMPNISDFQLRWEEAVEALEQSINQLRHPQEFGAIASRYLPYIAILPVFAALHTIMKHLPVEHRLSAQRKFRLWYWASVFTNRYSGSVESTSARDFIDVKTWFEDDENEPSLIGEFQRSFSEIDFRRATATGTSIYNGIFNLLVLNGARDWVSGNVPQPGDLHDHHIVPKNWSKDLDLRTSIDTILNRSPLTEETNRDIIKDRLPNEYLPEWIESNGETKVLDVLQSHFISNTAVQILLREPFGPKDFEDFITERRNTLHKAIEELLVKERLDLSPDIRELDARTERTELLLRSIITDCLNDDLKKLPGNVYNQIQLISAKTATRNPFIDSNELQTLSGMIEYSDLRHLQNIITNKNLWATFEEVFRSKDALNGRFQQLADLRNSIRHSRAVDEITRKDGEAALLWFEETLAQHSIVNP